MPVGTIGIFSAPVFLDLSENYCSGTSSRCLLRTLAIPASARPWGSAWTPHTDPHTAAGLWLKPPQYCLSQKELFPWETAVPRGCPLALGDPWSPVPFPPLGQDWRARMILFIGAASRVKILPLSGPAPLPPQVLILRMFPKVLPLHKSGCLGTSIMCMTPLTSPDPHLALISPLACAHSPHSCLGSHLGPSSNSCHASNTPVIQISGFTFLTAFFL